MKKLLLVSGIAFFGFATSFAQEKQVQPTTRDRSEMGAQKMSPDQIAAKRTERLDKMVGLTAEQKQKVNDVYLKQAKANKDRMAVKQDNQKEITSILTEDQNKKMEAMKEKRMEKMKSGENRVQRTPSDMKMEQAK